MKILVLNCGSSSLKYQLFDMSDESVLAKGLVERIGIAGSRIKHNKGSNDPVVRETDIPDHTAAQAPDPHGGHQGSRAPHLGVQG